jgi:hypothetical protein
MFNIILTGFYFLFPFLYQGINIITYWVTFRGSKITDNRIDSGRFLVWLNIISALFYISLYIVISLVKGTAISAGLFPTVFDPQTGTRMYAILRGTFWLLLINILTHSIMIKSRMPRLGFRRIMWFTLLCNIVSYALSLGILLSLS